MMASLTYCRINILRVLRNLSAENSKLSADSGIQRIQLLEYILGPLKVRAWRGPETSYDLWYLFRYEQFGDFSGLLSPLTLSDAVGCWCWDESLCVKNPFPFPVILTCASKLFQYPTRVNRLSAPKKLHQSKSCDGKKIASDLPVLQNVIPMLCCGQINLSPRFLLKPVLI